MTDAQTPISYEDALARFLEEEAPSNTIPGLLEEYAQALSRDTARTVAVLEKHIKDPETSFEKKWISVELLGYLDPFPFELCGGLAIDPTINYEIKMLAILAINRNKDGVDPAKFAEILGIFAKNEDNPLDKRIEAIRILESLGTLSLEALSGLLDDREFNIRFHAMRSLLSGVGEPAIPALKKLTHDETVRIRQELADSLSKIGIPAIPLLKELIKDPFPDVYNTAIWALGKIGEASLDTLIQESQEAPMKRGTIAGALGSVGEKAIPELLKLCQDENYEVRRKAIISLAQIGAPAFPTLLAQLEQQPQEIKSVIESLLKEIIQNGKLSTFTSRSSPFRPEEVAENLVDLTAEVLILRDEEQSDPHFSAETVVELLSWVIQIHPQLRTNVMARLVKIALEQTPNAWQRAVDIAKKIGEADFVAKIKEQENIPEQILIRIMDRVGGFEGAAFFQSRQQTLHDEVTEGLEPLRKIEEISNSYWHSLTNQSEATFKQTRWLNVALFVTGILLIIALAVILFISDELSKQLIGAIGTIGTFFAIYSKAFWKIPIENIQKFNREQFRLQIAFIGFMNRLTQLRLQYQRKYMEDTVSMEDLEQYQKMVSDTIDQAAQVIDEITRK